MRPLQFCFYVNKICCRIPKSTKNFTFHNVLLSYQLIRTAKPPQVGQIGCVDWLVAKKDIMESEFFLLILAFYEYI